MISMNRVISRFDHQKPDTSKNRVYQELRRAIVLGQLKPGEKLQLDNLAASYETSVTPVREALQMLTQEDLITSKPHSGYYVTQMTLKKLSDLFELREILELAAVERAAPQISDAQLEQLENVHTENADTDVGNYERAVIENKKFHYLIALASGNQELAGALGKVHDQLARFFVFVHPPDEVIRRHYVLIDALRSHDVNRATKTLLEEINETKDFTFSHVIEKEGTAWYLGASRDKAREK
ncbi:MAG: GntR family transcriptional regulator [Anaerolineales bacterium]|nr:GntR family transcriptional regulator [Anaerolineales bacterium]